LAWERLRERAGITNLKFHDLQHEAISRLLEPGLDMAEVATIPGHKDPKMLFRYNNLKIENLALKLE